MLDTAQQMSLEDVHGKVTALGSEIRKRIIGMDETLKYTQICLLAKGHILLEGVPGLAKTLFFKTLAEVTRVDFRRISFAADLLPKDVIGIEHFDPATRKLELVVKGPLHTNILLADELNRARTTSKGSVLEPMEEGQVTTELGGTYQLGDMFMVVATQNPVEEEGTFGLGRAERDRFLMMVTLDYPKPEEEDEIIYRYGVVGGLPAVSPVMGVEDILAMRRAIRSQVHVERAIVTKIQQIVNETRPERTSIAEVKRFIDRRGGASPRASLNIVHAARVHAVLQGRDFVGPDDIAGVLLPILRHRLVFKPGEVEEEETEMRLAELIDKVVRKVL